jgi:hypothetical protein
VCVSRSRATRTALAGLLSVLLPPASLRLGLAWPRLIAQPVPPVTGTTNQVIECFSGMCDQRQLGCGFEHMMRGCQIVEVLSYVVVGV